MAESDAKNPHLILYSVSGELERPTAKFITLPKTTLFPTTATDAECGRIKKLLILSAVAKHKPSTSQAYSFFRCCFNPDAKSLLRRWQYTAPENSVWCVVPTPECQIHRRSVGNGGILYYMNIFVSLCRICQPVPLGGCISY